jgi:hypothetical protein
MTVLDRHGRLADRIAILPILLFHQPIHVSI